MKYKYIYTHATSDWYLTWILIGEVQGQDVRAEAGQVVQSL